MWNDIGKAYGCKHPSALSVGRLWEDRATEAVLEFLRGTRVGYVVAASLRGKEGEDSGSEPKGGAYEGGRPTLGCISLSFSFASYFSFPSSVFLLLSLLHCLLPLLLP